jgi:GNAT superfamily N-acetyltransferase
VKDIILPAGFRLEPLRREHSRSQFRCGQEMVDAWLAASALQHQEKHLSVTRVLVDESEVIAGYYTLATGQVDFSDLPAQLTKRLPRRHLPVAVLAWLGVSANRHSQGLGRLLLAQSLRDCFEGGKTFAFVAVILDCIDEAAKAFYQKWDFRETARQSLAALSQRQIAGSADGALVIQIGLDITPRGNRFPSLRARVCG